MIVEMAQQIGIDPSWIWCGITEGRIEISKDSRYGCCLFARMKSTIARMQRLERRKGPQT